MIAKYMLAASALIAALSMLWIAHTLANPQIRANVNYNHFVDMWGHDRTNEN